MTEAQVASGELRIAQDDPKLLDYIRLKVLQPPAIYGPVLLTTGKDVNLGKTFEQQEVYRFILTLLKYKVNNGIKNELSMKYKNCFVISEKWIFHRVSENFVVEDP